jgi:flagellar secretion chaperone FliS
MMRSNPYQVYIDDEVLTADSVRLIQMLYRGAVEAIAYARDKLARNDVRARSGAITKAINILTELSSSLNHTRGGEISANLAQLYDYVQRKLIEANYTQTDSPLAEAIRLLESLEEAWQKVDSGERRAGYRGEHLYPGPTKSEYVPLSCAC